MIETLINKLEKVRKTGHGKWLARCPCHDDKTPSLSIRDNNGTVLMLCFGCGAKGVDVCETLGVDVNELFPPSDIDYSNYPQRKQQIPPDMALESLQNESTTIYLIAKDMLAGKISKEQQDRLLLACERIHVINVQYRG